MDLIDLGAREIAGHIKNGDVTAEAYFSRLIKRCQDLQFLNGIASLDPARMLEKAREIDQARNSGIPLGRAAGVAVAIKDQVAVAGYPAASGNPALRSYFPRRNADVVDALVEAGAVPFAKTTCPNMTGNSNLMSQADSYSPAYGPVRNPYDPARTPGGSSGGSAVVLAARMTPAALGEDTNGSVRLPAAFCGVAGLRPSTYTIENAVSGTKRKRYSDHGLLVSTTRLDTIGPMARTVADVAFLDELITGEPVRPGGLKGMRIAIPRPDYWEQEWVDARIATVTQAAFEKLRYAGARLIEFDYVGLRSTVNQLGRLSPMAMACESLNAERAPADTIAKWLAENMPTVTPEQFIGVAVPAQPREFGDVPDIPLEEQKTLLLESAQAYQAIFRDNGVAAIAAPTVPVLPQIRTPGGPTDYETIELNGKALDRASVLITQTVIAPRYGAPAVSVPMALVEGLPVGLELDGLPGGDTDILSLGMAVEKALGPLPGPLSKGHAA